MIRDKSKGKSFDIYLTPGLWQNCSNLRSLKQIHAAMVVNGFNSSSFALRQFVFAAAIAVSCGIDYAHKVFDHITKRDFFMWTTMIKGSAKSSSPENAVSLYVQMSRRGLVPGFVAHQYGLEACAKLSWVTTGLAIHGSVVKLGFFCETRVRNSLIYFHSHCGDLGVARDILVGPATRDFAAWAGLIQGVSKRGCVDFARNAFDEMPERSVVCLNVMISGYAMNEDMDGARRIFDEAEMKNVETWNALIAGYVNCGANLVALKAFEEMRRAGEKPNELTMLSLLSACTELGYLRAGKWIHSCLMEMSSGDFSILVGNALIRMYSKCGSIETAIGVFERMKDRDATTWGSMMRGLLLHGRAEEALDVFGEMSRLRVEMNEVTFLEVLVACCHTGRVNEGIGHFNLMRTKYKIKPNEKHYSCLVDMFGRAGMLDDAVRLIETMEVEPSEMAWRYLMRACRVHGNVELGKYARDQLLRRKRTSVGNESSFAQINFV